jgi:hypothetical protein|tara:strand:+ start:2468 stop:2737 length:270 start_codon:yes stop_codon:yes gene_type:complete
VTGSVRRRFVRVYRSSRRQEMYLYVDARADLEHVPEALLARFGKPVEALSLMLTEDRALARADAGRVLDSIEADGYYLQMPPPQTWGAP